MEMFLPLEKLHDASLMAIRFDWPSRTCSFDFSAVRGHMEPFSITFSGVRELAIPAAYPWGPSISVLSAKDSGGGRYEFAMQSGDTICVVVA